MEEAGGKALACAVDIRDENAVMASIEETVKTFGGIDIVVNNASAISLTGTEVSFSDYVSPCLSLDAIVLGHTDEEI